MFTLTHLDQLATVPVSESIKSFLHNQLITQPFGTLEADHVSNPKAESVCCPPPMAVGSVGIFRLSFAAIRSG
jgi:hypothetical protein